MSKIAYFPHNSSLSRTILALNIQLKGHDYCEGIVAAKYFCWRYISTVCEVSTVHCFLLSVYCFGVERSTSPLGLSPNAQLERCLP
ncbi:hypothetical protein AGOR_G00188570 [Albula goreensis]|uniref:Uncharacterized protein n=1 Tax=Albula goreensis TaxID=1534307 RepID=A0A8T3CSE0_9TELE|nr:hypothetical protein AGOR_G00188570 [Albula goreensis]